MKLRYNDPLQVGSWVDIMDENGHWIRGKAVIGSSADVCVLQLRIVDLEGYAHDPRPEGEDSVGPIDGEAR